MNFKWPIGAAIVGFLLLWLSILYSPKQNYLQEVTVCFEDETTRCFCRNEYVYNRSRSMECLKK